MGYEIHNWALGAVLAKAEMRRSDPPANFAVPKGANAPKPERGRSDPAPIAFTAG